MGRGRRRSPGDEKRALRFLLLKRTVQIVTMGAIVVFVLLSFVVPQDVGHMLLPLVIVSLAIYTTVSGFVAFEVDITGIGAVDSRPGWPRGVGIVWMFAGCFLAIFGLTYFFN